jgi:hypothetical protein
MVKAMSAQGFFSKSYNAAMTTTEQVGEQEKAKAEAMIAATPAFGGVEAVSVELGEDHTGDPSMWIIFRLRAGFKTDDAWFREFSDYSTQLSLKLLHSGLTRFPYTRLESAA